MNRHPDLVDAAGSSDSIAIHLNGLPSWPGLRGARASIIEAARVALDAYPAGTNGELSITLVDDVEMTRLNREWLGRAGSTDVIAFSLGSEDSVLGDVYIAPDTAARNAARFGTELKQEILRLVIHGTLHVLGLDHPEGEDREDSEMFRLQEELLRSLELG
ncbi:MAG: rRNA maturation RNase YbeY [Gemmatimonadota bacterium]